MAKRECDLVLENYSGGGLTTPVIVKELLLTLSASDLPKTSVGIECDKNSGWAWLVYARSLYVWNFKDRALICHELTLPSSGLIHCARLCHVFPRLDEDLARAPSCICVSPEGCVRYWPKISQSSTYVDHNIELSGQVGYLLTPLKRKNFQSAAVLSTTTCNSLLLTTPDSRTKKEQPIQCIPLKVSQNFISGIGRRVSSLIFAGLSSSTSQEALVNTAVVTKKGAPDTDFLYVLKAKCQMQCWQMELHDNKLLYEIDLRHEFMERLALEIWNLKPASLHSHAEMSIWALDFVITARRRFAVLVAVHDPSLSPYIYYSVVFFNESDHSSHIAMDVIRLPFTRTYEPRLEEPECNDLRLLCPFSYEGIFVHSTVMVAVSQEDHKNVLSKTLADGDQIFGSGVHGDQFLVFTLESGLQTTKILSGRAGVPFVAEVGDQRIELYQTRKSQEELDEMVQDDDRSVRFKAAFVYFLKQMLPESEDILEQLFSDQVDDLDNLIIQAAFDLLDDYPASDPRWVQAVSDEFGQAGMSIRQKSKGRRTGGGPLLLIYQLDDKRKTFELFLAFLKSMKLRERIGKYRQSDGRTISTMAFLCELGEKLEACAAFNRKTEEMPKGFEKLLRESMSKVLREREEPVGNGLGVQDVFYRKISAFHDFLPTFIEDGLRAIDKLRRQHEDDPHFAHDLFIQMADSILAILTFVPKYRRLFDRSLQWQRPAEIKTWLNSEATRMALEKFYSRITAFTSETVDSPGDDLVVMKQCRDLADSILAECATAPDSRLFEADLRRNLINALVMNQRLEHARSLAEKYRDFGLLIEICEKVADEATLEEYITKFRDEGFLDVLYDHYIKSGKAGKIFKLQNLTPGSDIAVLTARYLDSRRRPDLKWIFNIKMNDFTKVGVDILTLAHQEKESLEQKRTYFSLAKLAALASGERDSACLKILDADEGLVTIEHQKGIPSVAGSPPLSAEELIEACISDPAADEWSFARAVDLLASICALKMPKDDYIALRAHIWALAILKDDWNVIWAKSENLLEAASDTLFSRTLRVLCQSLKNNREKLIDKLAAADELLQCDELQELAQNPKFQYVIRAGEETVHAWALMANIMVTFSLQWREGRTLTLAFQMADDVHSLKLRVLIAFDLIGLNTADLQLRYETRRAGALGDSETLASIGYVQGDQILIHLINPPVSPRHLSSSPEDRNGNNGTEGRNGSGDFGNGAGASAVLVAM